MGHVARHQLHLAWQGSSNVQSHSTITTTLTKPTFNNNKRIALRWFSRSRKLKGPLEMEGWWTAPLREVMASGVVQKSEIDYTDEILGELAALGICMTVQRADGVNGWILTDNFLNFLRERVARTLSIHSEQLKKEDAAPVWRRLSMNTIEEFCAGRANREKLEDYARMITPTIVLAWRFPEEVGLQMIHALDRVHPSKENGVSFGPKK